MEICTIAIRCPAVLRVEIAPDFCCGVKDDLINSFPIPTAFAIVATASSLSPDKRTVLIPFCWSLPKEAANEVNTRVFPPLTSPHIILRGKISIHVEIT